MSDLLQITNVFYDAAWDFSTRLYLLPDQLTLGYDDGINPASLTNIYKEEIAPFLALNSTTIPKQYFTTYDQIESTIQEEVFPALDVLSESWEELMANPSTITKDSKLGFAEQCIHIIDILEMSVIAQTSGLREELRLQPA